MVETQFSVDTDDIVKRKIDSRGRITLGSEYAGEIVEVAVLDREGGDQ